MKERQYSNSGLTTEESEAIEGIVTSMVEIIEPCIRQRVIQWMSVVKETIKKETIL